MSEFSSAVATAHSLEEPGTNLGPPQTPAAEGLPTLPRPIEPVQAPPPRMGEEQNTEADSVLSAGANLAAGPAPKLGSIDQGSQTAEWSQPTMAMQQYTMLPVGLKQSLFCCWRYEPCKNSDKLANVPYDPRTGVCANTADPDTFASFEVAERALETGAYNGIGVLITSNLAAIDIDHCIDGNGQLSPLAEDIVKCIGSYTEISPSGRGIRIMLLTPDNFTFDKNRYYINNQNSGLEVYTADATVKYVTITGWALTSGVSLKVRGPELKAVLEKYMVRPQPQAPAPAAPPVSADARPMTVDIQLIEAIHLFTYDDRAALKNTPDGRDFSQSRRAVGARRIRRGSGTRTRRYEPGRGAGSSRWRRTRRAWWVYRGSRRHGY